MLHETTKKLFFDAVNYVTSDISHYTLRPDKDLTRTRKMDSRKLISFLVSCGASSTKIELAGFFGLATDASTAPVFNQQRAKLKSEALEAVFHRFKSSVCLDEQSSGCRFLAADGSSFTFFQ